MGFKIKAYFMRFFDFYLLIILKMKNLEFEKSFYLDLLNNITWLDYKIYWLELFLNWKMINKFLDLENLVKFLNIQYNNELLNYCKKQNFWK